MQKLILTKVVVVVVFFFFFFWGAVVGIGVVFFLFLASGLGYVLGSGWKKGWFDGDVDQNALIPSVVN